MAAYYNEFDPFAAQWLRNLIAAGLIPAGYVDERSILDVRSADLAGYIQHHFFAGIGGWSYAIRLAGWPDDRPVWTGSCPCQPLSSAGKRKGHADERHLWPAFYGLIAECQPATVFGEQVAGADGLEWLSAVRADLEESGYAVGAADLPAASVGAPGRRPRLYWVADSARSGGRGWNALEKRDRAQLGGSGSDIWSHEWPDGFGRDSTLPVSDVLSPSYGVPGRVGLLRGYGNAINPILGAEFVRAVMDVI